MIQTNRNSQNFLTFITCREVFQWQRLFTSVKPAAGSTAPASHKLDFLIIFFKAGKWMPDVFLKGKKVYKVSLWGEDLYQTSLIAVFSLRASLRYFTPLAVIWFWISLKRKRFTSNSHANHFTAHAQPKLSLTSQSRAVSLATGRRLRFPSRRMVPSAAQMPHRCTFRTRARSINPFLLSLHVAVLCVDQQDLNTLHFARLWV